MQHGRKRRSELRQVNICTVLDSATAPLTFTVLDKPITDRGHLLVSHILEECIRYNIWCVFAWNKAAGPVLVKGNSNLKVCNLPTSTF